jgi:insulysin
MHLKFPFFILLPIALIGNGFHTIQDQAITPLLNPDLSQRKSAKIELDNGLKAYLISDPKAEQSAACLSVAVGSWNDPKEFPGMAHFLEHMLFLGTEKYPDEAEYSFFIRNHGGLLNAYTAPDQTSYLFSINNDSFLEGLDRFSQFFIAPLFTPSCIARELNAVDQEHGKNLDNDDWRAYMVFKETGNPAHPNHLFSTGNAQTLSKIPQSVLKEWYHTHYSADRMRAIMISSLPLDQLISAVVEKFSQIPVSNANAAFGHLPLLSKEQKGNMTYIKPIKESRMLCLTWDLPENLCNLEGKNAGEVAAYILREGGRESLSEQLKSANIAESISADIAPFSRNNLMFEITIKLTEEGLKKPEVAIATCFEALARFKEASIPSYLIDELSALKKIRYQYQTREDAFHFVMNHSMPIFHEELETYPEKTSTGLNCNQKTLSRFLECLTPKECYFSLLADSKNIFFDRREPWMNVEYAIQPIENKKLISWKNSKPHPQISLPSSNPYIPTDLQLLPSDPSLTQPQLIADSQAEKVYYLQDDLYQLPEVSHHFHVKSPFFENNARSCVFMELYLIALKEQLTSTLFLASAANLKCDFSYQDLALTFNVYGFSEKSEEFFLEIIRNLNHVSPTKEQFAIYHQMLLTAYENLSKELPFLQANQLLNATLYSQIFSPEEKISELKKLRFEEFMETSANFLNEISIEALLYGNLSKNSAEHLYAAIKKELAFSPCNPERLAKTKILILPENQGPHLIGQMTERQGNAVILCIEQGPFSFEKRAEQQVLSKIIATNFFETLRTQQQIAYYLQSWEVEKEGQLMQFFGLQSNSHQPNDILARYELFLENISKHCADFCSREDFEAIRQSSITKLETPPENLHARGQLLNKLAFEYNGDFSFLDKRIASLKALSYETILQSANDFFSRNNTKRLAILLQGVLKPENTFRYELTSRETLKEQGAFVSYR